MSAEEANDDCHDRTEYETRVVECIGHRENAGSQRRLQQMKQRTDGSVK